MLESPRYVTLRAGIENDLVLKRIRCVKMAYVYKMTKYTTGNVMIATHYIT